MRVFPVVACIAASLVAAADPKPPSTAARTLALVEGPDTNGNWPVSIRVNDLPLIRTDHGDGRILAPEPNPYHLDNMYVLVPDLLLVKGRNVLRVTWDDSRVETKGVDFSLVELTGSEPRTVAKVLGKFHRGKGDTGAATAELPFEVTGDVPAWAWTSAPKITGDEATRIKLAAAAQKLGNSWSGRSPNKSLDTDLADQVASAKRAGFADDVNGTNLRKWIRHPQLSLDLRADDDANIEIIANGHLARLMWGYGCKSERATCWSGVAWAFKGGAHDAHGSQMGPVDIDFDVWFRLDHGDFVPVAVWQKGIGLDGT
jgi:hypothetical protein